MPRACRGLRPHGRPGAGPARTREAATRLARRPRRRHPRGGPGRPNLRLTRSRGANMRYFEDFKPGEVIELGSRTVTKEAIVAFATEFDPQVFHVDEEAAKRTIYGGLLASGWHTGSLLMRLLYEGLLKDTLSLGSPGIDELRWLRPVRPGDTLSARMTVTQSIPSRSKPDRGIIRSVLEMRNQHGEVVRSEEHTSELQSLTNLVCRLLLEK